jgi:AcrR family transcriptional regulator
VTTPRQAPKAKISGPKRDGRHVRGDRSRAVVLKHALQIASIEGIDGVTLGRLATDVAVSKGNLATLFGTREALQLATLDAAANIFREAIIERVPPTLPAVERLTRVNDAWFTYARGDVFVGGCLIHSTANEYRAKPGVVRDRAKDYYVLWRDYIADLSRRGQAEGTIRRDVDSLDVTLELMGYQQIANTNRLLDTESGVFDRIWKIARERIASLKT